MRFLFTSGSAICQKVVAFALSVLISVCGLFLLLDQPAYAASSSPDPAAEAKIDRAYEFSEEAGIREEIYQERLEEGQNLKDAPKPFQRIEGTNHREVPKTSFVEEATSKVRELFNSDEN
jgi:hypothetical protein